MRTNKLRKIWVYLAVAAQLLLGVAAQAQGNRGTVSGRVTDTSGGVLQGAQVSLTPGGASGVSDVQGEFRITGVDAGDYTVTVTYVGFKTFTKAVTLAAGQAASVDAKLSVESVDVEVVVTSERGSAEVEAVNRERTADNIVQVLPADVIRSLPNANMADALGRLPSVSIERDEGEGKYVQVRGTEPRLTNTTIDGVNVPSPESGVRQIKFDAIPADIVESVEISKTLQANMDGDGIGGSVNLVTKTAGERPTISIAGMGGYMPILGGRPQYESAATVGQRLGASKRWGLLIGGTYDWSGRGIDDIEPVSDVATFPDNSTHLWKDAIDIREYRYYRTRWGLAGSTDYKLGDGSNIYARGLLSDFQNYGDRWVYSLNDNSPVTTLNGNGGTPSFNTQDRRPDIAIGSLLIGGKHVLSTTWYAWDASFSRSRDINRAPGTAGFSSTLAASTCEYDPAATKDIYRPQWTPSCFTEAYDPTTMALSDVQIGHGKTAQVNFQLAGAMAKIYHLGSHLSTIEVGGKFRNAHKFDNTFTDTYTPNQNIFLNQFPNGLTNSNYYDGSYKLGYNVNYQTVRNFLMANLNQFGLVSSAGQDPGDYGLVEKVGAGYLMNSIDFSSRVRVVAGVRFENTSLTTFSFDTTKNTLSDKASGSYLKVLPSVSLRYAFNSNTNLRLAYGRGLSRPDPQDIAQAVTFTTVGSPGNQKNLVTLGNPNLKAETADNFDVLIEHYLNPFGMIEAGYFYKRLTDPIVTQTFILTNFSPAPGIPAGTFTATQPINAGSAWISGFEAAFLQHFTFLPGKLGGLGLSANYSYTASQASGLPGRSDHPRLLRNAPNTWNISPTYDRGRISIRVGLSYNQNNISSYSFQDGTPTLDGTPSTPTPGGLKGPFSDQYFYSHLQVDAQGSLRLTHGLSFVMYGLNLTNEVFGFYQGSPQYMIQREYYTPTIAAGFRWNPTFEKK
ncbi:MAG TPA: TonB-dependent receptor [Candidatus Acidoferrum sp.]|nr:TonB-dependent receptor [Candidatus Acidoferrum sp.]